MPTVVAFNGSPRKNGHCSQIIREIARGVESKGGTLKTYEMNDPQIRGCQGCFYCRDNADCAVKDPFHPVYAEIPAAAGIVFATPIYFGTMTGQAKVCIDRLFPVIEGMNFQPRWPGKKVVGVFAQGNPDLGHFQPAIDAVKCLMGAFGWEMDEAVISGGTGGLGSRVDGKVLAQAFAAGQKLVK